MLASEPELQRSVSVTTRAPRSSEINGVHYHFLGESAFQDAVANDELLEWARVLQGTHAYGTPRAPVEATLAAGRDVVFDIDWQGICRCARNYRPMSLVSSSCRPTWPPWRRACAPAGAMPRRKSSAACAWPRDEINHWPEFDHVVVNDDLEAATAKVRAILHAARSATRRQPGLADFVARITS